MRLYAFIRFTLVLVWLCPSAQAQTGGAPNPYDVTIVLSETGGAYGELGGALHKALGSRKLTAQIIDISRPMPTTGLIVGIGMKAATAATTSNATAVLSLFIAKADYEKLLHDHPRRGGSTVFSAVFLDQPAYRQAHLIQAILPGRKSVGLLYSLPPENLAELRSQLQALGIKLNDQAVQTPQSLADALQTVLNGSDALLALPDTAVYNSANIRNIVLATYRRNIPLIGISSGYVKAGALCAVISTPAQIAAQAAAMIGQFSQTHSLPPAQYPQEFEVQVNERVAQALGVQVKSKNIAVRHE